VPVISTSLGCEGLDAVDGVHLLVADTPEQFAAACARLAADPAEGRRLGEAGCRLFAARYSPAEVTSAVSVLAERVLGTPA
jgi:glycosyltransferase involved in cell wall biosynthesis